MGTALRRPAEG